MRKKGGQEIEAAREKLIAKNIGKFRCQKENAVSADAHYRLTSHSFAPTNAGMIG
jgi:hypothetical protein